MTPSTGSGRMWPWTRMGQPPRSQAARWEAPVYQPGRPRASTSQTLPRSQRKAPTWAVYSRARERQPMETMEQRNADEEARAEEGAGGGG
jgi:hypothetical protein